MQVKSGIPSHTLLSSSFITNVVNRIYNLLDGVQKAEEICIYIHVPRIDSRSKATNRKIRGRMLEEAQAIQYVYSSEIYI